MDELNPDGELCARCGKPAAGYAFIGDDRYCHPDDPDAPDCYVTAQFDTPFPFSVRDTLRVTLRDGR